MGHIVNYLRILGFDVCFDPSLSAWRIIEISKRENRIILTKNRKLLKFKEVTHAIFVRPGTTGEEIKRIIDYLDITWVKRFNVHGSRLKSPNSLLIKG